MFIIFGLLVLIVYAMLVFYIGWSGWSWVRTSTKREMSKKFRLLYIITLTIVASSFITARLFDNVILKLIGSFWMTLFYLLIILLPLMHVTVFALRYTRFPQHHLEKWPPIVTLALTVFLIGFGMFHAYSPTVETYKLQINKGASEKQLKIVMASDMHFGILAGKAHAQRLVEKVNELNADIVLFPGDILDDQIDSFVNQEMDEILANIKAEQGVYISLGNHDKHDGPIEELISTLELSNADVLYDEVLELNDVVLIGRRDRRDAERMELAQLTKNINNSKAIIVLDHQPYELDTAEKQGVDLMLSGHTHRGQIIPGNFITNSIYENDWGHLQKGQMHSIVSSGFGFWGPPIRIGSRSEIVEIEVTFGM